MDGQTNRQTDRIAISIWRVSMMTRDNKSRFFSIQTNVTECCWWQLHPQIILSFSCDDHR